MITARTPSEAATRSAIAKRAGATLGLLFGGCGPDHADPNPWGTLEIAYLASPTTIDGVVTRELRVTDAEGTQDVAVETARPVTSDAVAWSPDGRRIAYVGELLPSGGTEVDPWGGLFAVDRDEEELLAELSDGTGRDGFVRAASWSPGGDRIAVVRNGGSWAPQCQMDGLMFLVVNLGELAVDEDRVEVRNSDVDDLPPAWSPDGRSVAGGAERLVCGDDGVLVSFSWNVHVCAHDDGSCLSPFSPFGLATEADEWLGAWSPDSQWLAVLVGTRYGPPGSTHLHLWAADRTSARALTADTCSYEGAAWFPDGGRVLTRRSCGDGSPDHVVIDVMTGRIERSLPDLGTSPSIAPDGVRLLHLSSDDPPRISIFDLDNNRFTMLAAGEAPIWRPH